MRTRRVLMVTLLILTCAVPAWAEGPPEGERVVVSLQHWTSF